MNNETIILSGIFFLMGLIFQAVPVILKYLRKRQSERCTSMTTATITGYVCRRDDSSTTYAPVYHYWANGQEYEKTSTFSSSRRKHNTGDKITLYYDSSNPKIIYVEEEQSVLNLISVIFNLLGTVFMGIGVVVVFCTYYVR